MLTWRHEDECLHGGTGPVAGIDEAGRGCLAGPVVAGAVIFLSRDARPALLDDSKKLSRSARRALYEQLTTDARVVWAVGSATVEEIDRLNILRATHLAMQRALQSLATAPTAVLVDGLPVPGLGERQLALVGGDGLSPSVAAASILAKESRDRMMEVLDREHPGYGFSKHKGYGTRQHLEALAALGVSPVHRRSFTPVRQAELPLDS